jgi:hypothetical protein
MTNYVNMRTRILDEYVNESLTAAQVNAAIQTAIKHYERKPFYFNERTNTFSTVADQEYYSSSDLADIPYIVNIVSATVTGSTLKTKLQPVDFSIMDDMQDGSVTGEPEQLAVFKQQIRLYPIPSGVYTITLAYIYRFSALSADSDTNAWMVEGEELIRQRAKRTLALDSLQADDLAARAAQLESEALDELLAEGRRRLPNTVLRPEPILSMGGSFNFTRGY